MREIDKNEVIHTENVLHHLLIMINNLKRNKVVFLNVDKNYCIHVLLVELKTIITQFYKKTSSKELEN